MNTKDYTSDGCSRFNKSLMTTSLLLVQNVAGSNFNELSQTHVVVDF